MNYIFKTRETNKLKMILKEKEAELVIANKEIAFQNGEKADRAAELVIANKEDRKSVV